MLAILGIARQITKGDVFSYMLMPQVLPRLQQFYKSGFSQLAYMIALVYRGVRILPSNHIVFSPERRHQLHVHEVITLAARELKFDRKNIDKVGIFFLILFGLLLLAGQVLLTLGFLMMSPALAQAVPTTYGEFFATPNYSQDIAYRMLFSVFGVPELFNSGGIVNPYHTALHALFQFYSIGLLVIAVIITCYYVFAVLVETAQTGVPFGKRYNHVWTPIRLVVALGLLIPMGYGLNAAQWITLYAAKFGSDFATRGWVLFNETMTDAYLDNPAERVGVPQIPDLTKLAAFMMTASTCRYAYDAWYPVTPAGGGKLITAYLVKPNTASPQSFFSANFEDALAYYNNGDILIRFGQYDARAFGNQLGSVYPYCGDLVISAGDVHEPGAKAILEAYYTLVSDMWNGHIAAGLHLNAQRYVARYITATEGNIWGPNPSAALPPPDFKATIANDLRTSMETEVEAAVALQAASPTWDKNMATIAALGWGGAGIWYNNIAQINGSLVQATNNAPAASKMPAVLEFMRMRQLQQNMNPTEPYSMHMSDGLEMQFNNEVEKNIGDTLSKVVEYWSRESTDQSEDGSQTKNTSNIFIDTINLIFGTKGLFNMCANTDVHPLAQLSLLGKGLVDASIRNISLAVLAGAGASLSSVLGVEYVGVALGAASSILLSVASITIVMGFILFYVVPFMPFLYFFFAVGGWVKGLFEAMVGVPLWALAHLRIDGEGLPGDAAMDGYYLILEIFLRPILIIFGLLASVVIFAAMVKVLNEIFTLVVANLSGHEEGFTTLCGQIGGGGPTGSSVQFFRGPVDELFFTIMYAIIVYMIGMSCFKLIDLIPNNLMRYMGARVQTFNDVQVSAADGLMFRLSYGGQQVSGQLMSIGQGFGGTLSGAGKAVAGMATDGGKTS